MKNHLYSNINRKKEEERKKGKNDTNKQITRTGTYCTHNQQLHQLRRKVVSQPQWLRKIENSFNGIAISTLMYAVC